jgi:hypothetical protein
LILPRSVPVSAHGAHLPARGPGLSYLTFHLDDLDPVVAALTAAGVRPLSDPVAVRARGRRISFWADPEGSAVELVDARGDDPGPGIVIIEAVQ